MPALFFSEWMCYFMDLLSGDHRSKFRSNPLLFRDFSINQVSWHYCHWSNPTIQKAYLINYRNQFYPNDLRPVPACVRLNLLSQCYRVSPLWEPDSPRENSEWRTQSMKRWDNAKRQRLMCLCQDSPESSLCKSMSVKVLSEGSQWRFM